MATEIGSPPRFFHMPRFQHQAPRQLFYKRPDFAQQQAMQQLTFDGKRMRKAVNRKTIDYNPSVIRYLENRLWQRDHRDFRAIQPDAGYYNELVPPMGMLNNPMNAVTTKFVRTSTNKVKCPVFVVRAHDSPVRAMTWSHNDMWMLTADHGGYVKYWQSNMNNVKMFQAHKEAIREASFSPTDNKFATCSDDGTVRIWDFLRCHEERILRGHGADVKCVDWHPTKGLVVSGSKDSQQPIKFWDPKTGQSLATLHAHKNTVMEVKWNLNGNWLLTASRDHLCKLFDIRNLKEELQVFRGHKKEATAVAWHPVHEGLFASGGSDGSLLFWHTGVEKEVGGMEMAHEGMIWSLAWHPLGHILCSGSNDHTSKFWTRNRPGDKMRDRYNLNLLPGMSEDGVEYDDIEPNNLAAIPGMGIPEQLKMAMEQEQAAGKEEPTETEMTIPGLDWGMEEVMQKDQKKVPQKKVPYAKPIPAQFQQAWAENKVPTLPPGELPKERKDEKKVEVKKKTQAEIEQEMAALQYTNPLLLEQMKIERMAQKQSEQGQPPQQGAISSFPNQTPLTQASPNFQQPLQPQQMPTNINPMGSNGPQVPFLPQKQMGPPGPQLHQSHPTQQGFLGPQEVPGSQGIQRHPAPLGPIGPQGPPGMSNNKGIHVSPGIPPGQRGMQGPPGGMPGHQPCGIGPRDSQGSPIQGNMMGPQDLRGIPNQGTLVNHPLDLDMRGHQVPPVQGAMMGQPSHGLQGQQNQSRGPQVQNQGPPPLMSGIVQQGPGPSKAYLQKLDRFHFEILRLMVITGRFENYDGPIDEFEQLRSRDQRRAPHGRHNQEFDYEQTDESYRRGGSRHESRSGRGFSDDFTNEDSFEKEEKGRSWESGGNRGRNRGPHRGGRKGLLPTPDEFPSHYEGGRKSESWDGSRDQGHEHFRDGMRQDHPPRECSSPAGRDRSSSLQGMDMASLPPRKRPWHDGPGTADVRERDSPGRGPEERTPALIVLQVEDLPNAMLSLVGQLHKIRIITGMMATVAVPVGVEAGVLPGEEEVVAVVQIAQVSHAGAHLEDLPEEAGDDKIKGNADSVSSPPLRGQHCKSSEDWPGLEQCSQEVM
ncbi:WDR33 protein, partial [Polypterus senegalus]